MAKVEVSEIQKLQRAMIDLLSEYGIDRAGIDAAIDIAIEHGETDYQRGYDHGYDAGKDIFTL